MIVIDKFLKTTEHTEITEKKSRFHATNAVFQHFHIKVNKQPYSVIG